MTAGDRIKDLMKMQKISQNRLAKMAGISQSGLSSIVNGDVSAKEDTLQRIAEALGCTTAHLLGETNSDDITAAEREMIRVYRSLNRQGKEYIRQQFAIAGQLYAGESVSVPGVVNE